MSEAPLYVVCRQRELGRRQLGWGGVDEQLFGLFTHGKVGTT
jgi:hypothetical protein